MKRETVPARLLEELTRTKIRVNNANAEKNEIKNKVMRGELIPIDDVNKQWIENCANVKAKLLSIPSKITPRLANKKLRAYDIEEILTQEIYEALNELAEEYQE